jgi:large subunit ribosomal protein L3
MKGILGRKVGMTQVFTKDGKLVPVTVVSVEPNVVTQVKTVETDGYNAIQLATVDKKEKNASKASVGHAKKANTTPKRYLKEIRDYEGTYNLGDKISADVFTVGEFVDVTGTSKGHGTEGVIERWNQSRGPMAHGSRYHRRPGSMGTMLPMHVLKGKKLPGHMGVETTTIQNLEIIEVNAAENYILVSGNVPGAKKSLVLIKSAVKKGNEKTNPKEIISFTEETVVDEVVEETPAVEETVEAPAEEVVEETVEAPVEEVQEEQPAEEAATEEVKEEAAEENQEESK